MFGNSNSSFGNIFGGNQSIRQSHERLFGGDRNLATKDIEGAQPRKFTKHVWGHFQANEYNSQLSYNPQQSTIRSPILGDNVQPLNRAIPNSSGMIFRHNLASTGSSLAKGDNTTASATKSTIALSTANNQYVASVKSPTHSGNTAPQQKLSLIERFPIRSNIPPSQLKEQNIFSPSAYFTIDPKLMTKPIVNVGSQPAYPNTDRPSITSQLAHSSSQAALRSKRSPDMFAPTSNQKEYKREQVSSYEFGRHSVKSDTPFIDEALQVIGQNPIFTQNRNYGPDSVLYNEQNQVQSARRTESSLAQLSNSKQKFGINRNSRQASRAGQEQGYMPQQQLYDLHAENAQRNPVSQLDQPADSIDQLQQKQFENNASHLRPASNRSAAAGAAGAENGSNNNEGIEKKSLVRFQPVQRSSLSNIDHRIRSALSARGNLVLGSPLVKREITTNSEYGTYLNFQRPQLGSPQLGNQEKVLYQSKRDNFLRSHLPRSQSAEGTRLSQSLVSPNQQAQIERKNSAVRRGFNIIGNYPLSYRSNADLFQSGNASSVVQKNNFVEDTTRSELKKSGSAFAPIAGMQNVYAEFNSENPLYNKNIKSPPEPHQVKFFGAKALKNLSNVKLY